MTAGFIVRRTVRVLATGALPGALAYLGMFALSVGFHASADYMGVEDHSVSDRVMALFADAITAQQLGILFFYVSLGLALGLIGTVFLGLRDAVFYREFSAPIQSNWSDFALEAGVVEPDPATTPQPAHPARGHVPFWGRSRLNHCATIFGLVLLQHVFMLVASMAAYPAVYAFAGAQFAPMGWLLTLSIDVLPGWLAAFLPWFFPLSALVFASILIVRTPPRFIAHRRALPLTLALGLALGLAVALTARPPRLAPRPSTPTSAATSSHLNVILLAVDSMRADLLRDHPEAVPNLAALARRATLFTRAIPTVPRTYPSWASMMTGRYPHDHGIRHMFPVPPKHDNGLVIEHGLPEALRAAGYRTGVVSDFAGDVFRRADWGFETVDTPDFTLKSNVATGGVKLHLHLMPWLLGIGRALGFEPYREELLALERLADPTMVEDAALDFVAADPDKPFFLVAFFSAGHFPFASPSPWWRKFTDPDYAGRSRFLKQSFGAALEGIEFEAEKKHLGELYRGAVAASDASIGRLLDALRKGGALDNTLVIVTADHGENLYEYGLGMGHGDHLYGRTTLEVPLVIDYPGNPDRARTFEMPVSLADIGATIAAQTGVDIHVPANSGVDLTAAIHAPEALARRPIFSEIDLWFFPPETHRLDGKRIVGVEGFAGFTFDPKSWAIFLEPHYQPLSLLAKHRMVLANGRKLLYVPTRDGVRWELYDPLSDPGDAVDLATKEPDKVKELQSILWQWMLSDPSMKRVGDFLLPTAMP